MSRIKKGYLLVGKKKFPVFEGVNLVGRSKQSTIMILENTISHQQAEIIIINDKHYICDMNSCNGTQLEHGKLVPLQLYELGDKKIIYFGNIKVIYELLLHKSNSQDDSQYSQVNDSVFDIPTQIIPTNEIVSINTNIELDSTVPTINELPTQLMDDNNLNITLTDVSKPEKCTSQKYDSIYDMPTQINFVDESKKDNKLQFSGGLLQQINDELKDIPDKSWDEDFFTNEPTQNLSPNNQQDINITEEKGLGQGDNKDKEQPKTSSDDETCTQSAPNELSVIDETVINETIQNNDEDVNSNCSEDFLNVIPVTELFDDIPARDDSDQTSHPPDSTRIESGRVLSTQSTQEYIQTKFLKRKIKNVITSDDEGDVNDETHITPSSSADNHPSSLRVDLLKRKVRNIINSDSECNESSDETDIDVKPQESLKTCSESSDETDLDLKIDKNKNRRKKKLVKKQSHKKDDQKSCSGSETDIEYDEKVNNNQLDDSDFVPASQNCFVYSLSSFQKNTKLSQSSNKSKESNSQTSMEFSLDLMLTESFSIDGSKSKLPTIQENTEDSSNQDEKKSSNLQSDHVEGNILMPPEDLDVLMKPDEPKNDLIIDKDNQKINLKEPKQPTVPENSQNEKSDGDIQNLGRSVEKLSDDKLMILQKDEQQNNIYSETTQVIDSDQHNKSKDEISEPTQPVTEVHSTEVAHDISSEQDNKSKDDEIFLKPTQLATEVNSSTSVNVHTEATQDISSEQHNKSKNYDEILLEPTQLVTEINSSTSEDVRTETTQDISSDQINKSKNDDDIFLEPTQLVSAINSSTSEKICSESIQDISCDQPTISKDDDEIFLQPTQPITTINSCTSEKICSGSLQDTSCDQPNKFKDDDDEIFLAPTQPITSINSCTSRDKDIYSEPTQEIVSDQSNTSKDTDDIFLEPTQPVTNNSSKSLDKDIFSEPTQEIVFEPSNTTKDGDEQTKKCQIKNVFVEPRVPIIQGSSKKARNVDVDDDDDIFLGATQPVLINDNNLIGCVPNDVKKQDETEKINKIDENKDDIFMQPTQVVEKNVSNTHDDDIFLQATQPVFINNNNRNYLKKVDEVTQPVVTSNALQRTSKLEICKFPAIQIRDDLYEAGCSKNVDTVEESMEKMFQTQTVNDDLDGVNRNSVESQMEILFASQLPNTKSDCRPQNPLANILENLQSQNEMSVPPKDKDEVKKEKEVSKPGEIGDVKHRIKKSEKSKDNDEGVNKVKEKRKSSRKKSKNEDELLEILQTSKIQKEKVRRHKTQNEAGTSKEKDVSTHSKNRTIHLDQAELSSSIEKATIDVAKKSEYVHKIKVAPQSNNPEADTLKPKKAKVTPENNEKCTSSIDPKKSSKVKESKPEKNAEIEHEDLPKRKTRLRNKSVGGTPEEDIKTDIHKIKKKISSRLEPIDDLKENKHHKIENNNANKTEHEHKEPKDSKEHRSNIEKQENDQKIPSKRSHRTRKSSNPLPEPIDKTIGDSITKPSSNKTINLSSEEPNVPFGDNSDLRNETQRSKRKANPINANKPKLRKRKNDGELSLIDELPEFSDSPDDSANKGGVIDLTETVKNVNEMKTTKTSKRAAVVKVENTEIRQKQRRRSSASEDDFIAKAGVKRSKLDVSKRDLSQSSNTSDIINSSGGFLTPERSRRKLKPKVVFTMMDNPELESLIRRLGGSIVDTVDSSTVLMTMNVKRSLKLLTAIGQGKPICAPEWLDECKRANQFLDPWDFILRDPEAETKWNFSLKESLSRSRNKKIFENYFFLLLTNVALDVLKGSIEACGGKSAQRCPPKYQNIQNFVVVSQEENRAKYSKYLKQDPHPIVIHYEAVLDAILRQEINFVKHFLT